MHCNVQEYDDFQVEVRCWHCRSVVTLCKYTLTGSTHPQILQDLVKLAINDLARINVAVQRFQLLIWQPIRGPLRIIKTVPKLGLQYNKLLTPENGSGYAYA